jgi:phosphonate transport system permease protein
MLFPRVRFPKARVAVVLLDWAIWGYLSYCAFFLINYIYKALIAVSIHDRLTFPSYGWPLALLGSLAVALLWENLGASIGQKAHGLVLVREDLTRASRRERACHLPLDVLTWMMSLCALGLVLLPLAGLATWLHGIVVGTGVSFIPAVALWPAGSWSATLGYSLLSVLVLVAGGGLGAFVATHWVHWLWGSTSGRPFWCDRVCGLRLVPADEAIEEAGPPRRWFKTSSGLMIILLISITLCVGWLMVEVDVSNLIRRAHVMGRTVSRLLNADFSTFTQVEPILNDNILTAMIETIYMALLATLLGGIVALPLSFLGARNLMARGPLGWIVYTVTRAFFNAFRSIEVIIWAIIFAVWVGFGPFAGVIALAIHTVAALGKLYSEQVESIDPGPPEAIAATGARRWQVIIHGIIPQVIPSFLAFTLYRWDINVRMSTIIGLVGGGGIGQLFFFYKDTLEWEKVGAVLVAIVIVVWSMDYISGRVRERIT